MHGNNCHKYRKKMNDKSCLKSNCEKLNINTVTHCTTKSMYSISTIVQHALFSHSFTFVVHKLIVKATIHTLIFFKEFSEDFSNYQHFGKSSENSLKKISV